MIASTRLEVDKSSGRCKKRFSGVNSSRIILYKWVCLNQWTPPESQKKSETNPPSPSLKDAAKESQKKTVWVFGYGSLMWDNWETAHGCLRHVAAVLPGFRRAFNKPSVNRWGTRDKPCPTLNLAAEPLASCKGVAFEFPEEKRGEVLDYLAQREAGFDLNEKEIRLENENGDSVMAVVAIYAGKTF
jgi:hypothetical protein